MNLKQLIKQFFSNECLDDTKEVTKEELDDMQGHLRLVR